MDNKMRELNSVDLILEMLKNKHYAQARQAILDHNAVDIAEILAPVSPTSLRTSRASGRKRSWRQAV